MGFVAYMVRPEQFLAFPKERFGFWLVLMILYPLLSALPQELIWRVFFFHRYSQLFAKEVYIVLMSAFAFGYLHIIYDDIFSVLMTLVAGYFFSKTYQRSDSLLLATLEHALYGMLVFTIGFGDFFYEGRGGN